MSSEEPMQWLAKNAWVALVLICVRQSLILPMVAVVQSRLARLMRFLRGRRMVEWKPMPHKIMTVAKELMPPGHVSDDEKDDDHPDNDATALRSGRGREQWRNLLRRRKAHCVGQSLKNDNGASALCSEPGHGQVTQRGWFATALRSGPGHGQVTQRGWFATALRSGPRSGPGLGLQVLSFLDSQSLTRLESTCREWRQFCQGQENRLWGSLLVYELKWQACPLDRIVVPLKTAFRDTRRLLLDRTDAVTHDTTLVEAHATLVRKTSRWPNQVEVVLTLFGVSSFWSMIAIVHGDWTWFGYGACAFACHLGLRLCGAPAYLVRLLEITIATCLLMSLWMGHSRDPHPDPGWADALLWAVECCIVVVWVLIFAVLFTASLPALDDDVVAARTRLRRSIGDSVPVWISPLPMQRPNGEIWIGFLLIGLIALGVMGLARLPISFEWVKPSGSLLQLQELQACVRHTLLAVGFVTAMLTRLLDGLLTLPEDSSHLSLFHRVKHATWLVVPWLVGLALGQGALIPWLLPHAFDLTAFLRVHVDGVRMASIVHLADCVADCVRHSRCTADCVRRSRCTVLCKPTR